MADVNDDIKFKKYGFYRGKVVKHLENGYCKIWIPGVYPEDLLEKPDCLPDAEQAAPLMFGGGDVEAASNGSFNYPDLNSIVWCFFQNGDQNFPVYFAYTLGGSKALDHYKKTKVNDNPEEQRIIYGSSKIIISKSGDIEISNDKGASIKLKAADGGINISGKEIHIDSNSTMLIESNTLHINGKKFALIESESGPMTVKSATGSSLLTVNPAADRGYFTTVAGPKKAAEHWR